jgi:hypothetical protein
MLNIKLIKKGLDYDDATGLWGGGPVVCRGYIREYFVGFLGNEITPDHVMLNLHYRPFNGSNTAILTGPNISVYRGDGSLWFCGYCYSGLRYYILKEIGVGGILDSKSHHVFFKLEDAS